MSHSQFHSTNLFILRHAWLNLWDKHMTTGRINQVTTFQTRPKTRERIPASWKPNRVHYIETEPIGYSLTRLRKGEMRGPIFCSGSYMKVSPSLLLRSQQRQYDPPQWSGPGTNFLRVFSRLPPYHKVRFRPTLTTSDHQDILNRMSPLQNALQM